LQFWKNCFNRIRVLIWIKKLLESLKKIFNQSTASDDVINSNEELNLLCGLMIEAAQTDGKIDEEEINKISNILTETFEENIDDVKIEINKCIDEVSEPKSLHSFTSKINKIFSDEKKILLIQVLWEIVLSDGKIHEYESNLIRRLAGLLYVSDVNCGNAKKRALSKLNGIIQN
tara:strand:+ start:953 stop:1474 length:522 start_codon:yes stop_codon:yes gene_type:complete